MAELVEKREISKQADSEIVKKANARTSSAKTIRGLKTLPEKIQTAREAVERYLGNEKDKYECITDVISLNRYIDKCIKNGVVALDTETTGLDVFTVKLVGVSLYTKGEKAVYIPINHTDYTTMERVQSLNELDIKQFLEKLTSVNIVFFNADYDIRVIKHTVGVELTAYYDAYIATRVLNENEPDNVLKHLHSRYVLDGKEEEYSFGELFDKIPFDLIPIDVAYLYAAKDALITFELYEFQLPYLTVGTPENTEQELEGVANVFWNIEMPIVSTVINMEELGVGFDFEYQKKLSVEYNEELKNAENHYYETLHKYVDGDYLISSPKQLSELFYDVLHLLEPVYDKKTKTYKKSVDVDALESINHPIAQAILEYRTCAKLVQTYVDKMAKLAERDGRVHGLFNQVGTDTGRFSSKDPNLQNIPSHNTKIRKMFIPSEGCVFVGGDFSAQEPRIVSDLSGDTGMIGAYKSGKDLYCEIASMAFHVPYEQCLEFNPDGTTNHEGKERRSIAKKIVLSINYGKGINNLALDLGKTKEEAQEIFSAVLDAYPDLKKFIQDSKDMAKTKGYVTTKFGRKRRLVDCQLPPYDFQFTDGGRLSATSEQSLTKKLNSMWFKEKQEYIDKLRKESHIIVKDNGGFISRAERQCVNARVQGTAADCVKIIMRIIDKDEILNSCKFKLCLQVHDEVIGECPVEYAKTARDRLKYLMEHSFDEVLSVPMKADISVTDRWYGEELEL